MCKIKRHNESCALFYDVTNKRKMFSLARDILLQSHQNVTKIIRISISNSALYNILYTKALKTSPAVVNYFL